MSRILALPLQPLVSVVVATAGRPRMLRAAVQAIMSQDYIGPIEVIVVFDGIEIDPLDDVDISPKRNLRVMGNSRTKGLAGGRNTGILAAAGDVIGFCDDDDEWHRSKLRRQVELWRLHPEVVGLTTGIRVRSSNASFDRLPPARTDFSDFLKSRITAIHPSTMLYLWEDLMGRVGLVDEAIPGSYGEDYDLLLRATRFGDIVAVEAPLVTVHWDRASFFAGKWRTMADGITYLLRKYPEMESSPQGLARMAAQVAFALAALDERRSSYTWARAALQRDPRQLRAYAALAICLRLVPAQRLLKLVQSQGRGL